MQNLFATLKDTLRVFEEYFVDGQPLKGNIIQDALSLRPQLLKALISHQDLRKAFFQEVDQVLVFDKVKFQRLVHHSDFQPNSYTAFKNEIGLLARGEFLKEAGEVVLAWPYKDCVLEDGQSKEQGKRSEVFWNETLTPDVIDRLLEPKALTNFKTITKDNIEKADRVLVTDNLLIKGNNLLTLHTLKKLYRGQIKLIYIDPPYNTGKDSFGYHDNFSHSTWLTFMKNRLEVARELLKNDGVIFISIDINEQAYLKVLCDELFQRENFVGEIIWETATDNNAAQISIQHEYVLCYAKNKALQDKWQIKSEKAQIIQRKYEELKDRYKSDVGAIEKALRSWINSLKKSNEADISGVSHYCYVDERGVFYPGNPANTRPGGYRYDILHPVTKKVCKKPGYGYRWPEDTFWEAEKRGDVLWGEDESTIPKIKKRLDTATELLKGYYYEDNRRSTQSLTRLMGSKVFNNPKSINLLKKMIQFTTKEHDIVLDFFAGSGSTAEAVLEVGREQKARRQFILCEQLDYIEKVTQSRIRKCLQDEAFVYCELLEVNERFIGEVQCAQDHDALLAVWRRMEKGGTLSWKAGIQSSEDFERCLRALDLPDARRVLIEALDKNPLYLPLSEIEDRDFQVSEEVIALNQSFFSQML